MFYFDSGVPRLAYPVGWGGGLAAVVWLESGLAQVTEDRLVTECGQVAY